MKNWILWNTSCYVKWCKQRLILKICSQEGLSTHWPPWPTPQIIMEQEEACLTLSIWGGGLLQSFKGWHPHCAAGFTECFWLRVFGFLKEWCLKVLAQRQTPEFRPQRGRCIVVKRQRLHSSDFGLAASAFCQLSISLALGGPPCSEPKVTSNPAQGAQAHPVKKDYGCQRWALWLRFRESGKLQSFLFFSFLLFLGGVGWGGGNNIWNAHFNEVFFFNFSCFL